MQDNFLVLLQSFVPLFVSSFIAAHTPGPNNIMILQSCTVFGYRRSNAHRMGIVVGFLLLVCSVNIIFLPLLRNYPNSLIIVKIIGTVYYAWLAYKIIFMDVQKITSQLQEATTADNHSRMARPLTFFQAFLFQWVNVKAILYSISIIALIPEHTVSAYLIFVIFIPLNTLSAVNAWSLIGVVLNRLIEHKMLIRVVNCISGIVLLWFCLTLWLL